MYEDSLDDSMSLKSLYDKYVFFSFFLNNKHFAIFRVVVSCLMLSKPYRIRPQIPVLKEVQPLLEMDRDERKLDIFLTFHRSSLLVSDMKIFLPFTINLDPYIKKKIKEEQQSMEEEAALGTYKQYTPWTLHNNGHEPWSANKSGLPSRTMKLVKTPSLQGHVPVPSTPSWVQPPLIQPTFDWQTSAWVQIPPMEPTIKPLSATTMLPVYTK